MSSSKSTTITKKKAPGKRRSLSPSPSAPELKLSYQAAGRETLAAIDQELRGRPSPAEPPVIEISEAPAGRETLAAIAEELAGPARERQDTLPYADKIKNADGARLPSRLPEPPKPATPKPLAESAVDEVTVRMQRPPLAPQAAVEGVEIFELLTFLVRGSNVGDLSTDTARRRFVQDHLRRRIPGGSLDVVERIEVTPWTTKGTMVLRIWCRS